MTKKVLGFIALVAVCGSLSYQALMDSLSPVKQQRAFISLEENSMQYNGDNIIKLLHPDDVNGGNMQPYALLIKPSLASFQFNHKELLKQAKRNNQHVCLVTYRGIHIFNTVNPRLLKLENCQKPAYLQ